MKISTASYAVVLDTRRPKADNTFPLKLRITYQRVRKYYGIGMDLTEEQWAEICDKSKKKRELREPRERIASFEQRASEVIKKLDSFSFAAFERIYFQSEEETAKELMSRNDVTAAFEKYIEQLNQEGRASTATAYQTALNSLQSYRKRLKFDEITADFLKGYEARMLLDGKSATTIGIYLRALRTIVNQALDKGTINRQQYPFGKHRYQIPAGRNIKKALTLAEIEKLFHFKAQPGSQEEKARDLWIFSYLCNGMNVKDMCRLRWRDVDGDRICFIRAKTARTTKANQRPVMVALTEPVWQIIHKWGNTDRSPESRVFPFLPVNVTPQRERDLVQNLTKFINKWMQNIAKAVGINKPVSTYFARHSFATVLKRSGAPIEFISESLGHYDLKTTENYLDSFEDNVKRQYASALLKFSTNKKTVS